MLVNYPPKNVPKPWSGFTSQPTRVVTIRYAVIIIAKPLATLLKTFFAVAIFVGSPDIYWTPAYVNNATVLGIEK